MKIYLQYPWKFPDSPYYKYLVNYPPTDVIYKNVKKEKFNIITSSNRLKVINKIKTILRKTLNIAKIPNLTYSFARGIDLIHCAHCLSFNKKPWVTDLEHYWTFASSGEIPYSSTGRTIIFKLLKNDFCKKILPWTHAAENTISEVTKNIQILTKLEVLYPAVPMPKINLKKPKEGPLLFIGRYFYQKGGLFVLEVFKRLKQKYDIDCTFISLTIPKQFKLKYGNFVKIYESVSDKILFQKIYPSSSIFVYPGFSDTFGFAMLEAMSFNIPTITVDAFARKEIIEDDKNGFLIGKPTNLNIYNTGRKEEKLIEEMMKKTSLLIEDTSLRKKMGKYGRKLAEKGKFSIRARNKKLKEIYENALSV